LAKKLGAHHYIDSGAGDAAAELQKPGGAVILATAPNAQAISALVDGLSSTASWLCQPLHRPLTLSAMPLVLEIDPWWAGIRHSERFTGHIGIQRADRRAPDDRNIRSAAWRSMNRCTAAKCASASFSP
jgi:hypothetical protein